MLEALTPAEPKPKAARYRPRRSTSDRVSHALEVMASGLCEILTHEETSWSSITFAGTRHEVVLRFEGAEAVGEGERLIEALPDHEFRILPGHLVADASVREIDHRFGADECLIVTCVLLLLEEV